MSQRFTRGQPCLILTPVSVQYADIQREIHTSLTEEQRTVWSRPLLKSSPFPPVQPQETDCPFFGFAAAPPLCPRERPGTEGNQRRPFQERERQPRDQTGLPLALQSGGWRQALLKPEATRTLGSALGTAFE